MMKSHRLNAVALIAIISAATSFAPNAQAETVKRMWEQVYNGPANSRNYVIGMALDGAGNVVVTGNSAGTSTVSDFYTAKYRANTGQLLWERRYNGPSNSDDNPYCLAMDSSGNAYVTGVIGYQTRPGTQNPTTDGYIVKYSAATGEVLWEKVIVADGEINGFTSHSLGLTKIDNAGNAVVVAHTTPYAANGHWSLIKYSPGGDVLWEKQYPISANPNFMAIDSSGNIAIACRDSGSFLGGPGTGTVYYSSFHTLKVSGTNGALLWDRRYDGPVSTAEDGPAGVAMDGAGNVIVTGYSNNDNFHTGRPTTSINNRDFYTAKYDSATGAVLWERRYNSPLDYVDEATDLELDSAGDVIVTGNSWNGSGSYDRLTTKYSGVTGDTLWKHRDLDSGNTNAGAHALTLDAAGNAVIACPTGFGAKYSAADGTLIWQVSEGGDLQQLHAEVDPEGNIAIACTITTGSSTSSLLTRKYGPVYPGTYSALVVLPAPLNSNNVGFVTLNVSSAGMVTGKLTLGKLKIPFTGIVEYNGKLEFDTDEAPSVFEIIDRNGQNIMDLALTINSSGVTGTLIRHGGGGEEIADFSGELTPYNKENIVPLSLLNVATSRPTKPKGVYNVVFASRPQVTPLDASLYPQGEGMARLTLSANGTVVIVGDLADGTKFSATGILRGDGSVPFMAKLYKGKGCIAGELTFADLPDSDVSGTDLLWARPAIGRAPAIYPQGWPDGIRIDAIGTKWAAPASLDFGQGPTNPVNGNASLIFLNGLLPSALTKPVSIDPQTGSAKAISTDTGIARIALTGRTGLFRGTFKHSDQKTTNYRGILLNKGATKGGFGYFLKKPTAASGESGQSGSVELDPDGP